MSAILRYRRDALRPFALLVILAILFALLPVFDSAARVGTVNVSDILNTLATLGLVTLALGLSMIAGEFDLSVSSTYLLGSILAVKTGVGSPLVGVLVAMGAGLVIGLIQGLVVSRLGINSIAVTLGGFITVLGLVYVISNNQTLSYPNQGVSTALTNPIASVFSVQVFVAIGVFVLVALILMATALGRNLRAIGSDRKSARVVGLRIPLIVTAVFATSAVLCTLSGALQGYSLQYAAPTQTVSPLIFATTAALLGGVPLSGGRGNPISIAAGALSLGIVTEAIPVLHSANYVNSLLPAVLLLIVTIVDAPDVLRWWRVQRARRGTVMGLRRATQPRQQATDES